MKILQALLIFSFICFSLQNKADNGERLLPLACERIVDNFKRSGNLDKLNEAISTLFCCGIKDEHTESISKWLLAYQFEKFKDKFIRTTHIEKEEFFRTAHYEYVTEEIFRETIKKFL